MAAFGIEDSEFIRGKVPMTKAEIRAMVMVKAAIQDNDIVARHKREDCSKEGKQRQTNDTRIAR